MEVHPEHDDLFRDEDMIEYGPETRYLSSSRRYADGPKESRVLAEYSRGKWDIEAQVNIDGDWYVDRRESLENPPENAQEFTRMREPVESNQAMFTGLSGFQRVLLSPLYAVMFAYYCVSGKDVNVQVIDEQK